MTYEITANTGGFDVQPESDRLITATRDNLGHLSAQAVLALEDAIYFDRRDYEGPVWNFCADDRELIPGSAERLARDYPDVMSPYYGGVGSFGQNAGDAIAYAIAGMVQHGPNFLHNIGPISSLIELRKIITSLDVSTLGVRPAQHSALAAEQSAFVTAGLAPETALSGEFCVHGDAPHACAACNNFGTIAIEAAKASETRFQDNVTLFDIIQADIAAVCDGDTMYVEPIIEACEAFAKQYGGLEYGRQDYVRHDIPAMLLEGDHRPPNETQVMINLDPEKGSIAGESYRADVGASTLADTRALWPYKVPPEVIIPVKVAIATIIRRLLTANLNGDPRDLPMGVYYGDVTDYSGAIERIKQLQLTR